MAYARYQAEIEEAKKAGIPDDVIEEVINQRIEDAKLLGHSEEEVNTWLNMAQTPETPATKRPEFDFGFLGWGESGRKKGAERFKAASQQVDREGFFSPLKKSISDVGRGFAGGATVENLPQDYSKIYDPNAYNLGKTAGTVLPANLAFKGAGMLTKAPLIREGIAGALYGAAEKPEEEGSRVMGAATNALLWPAVGGTLRTAFRAPAAAIAGYQAGSLKTGLKTLFNIGQKGGAASMPIVEEEVFKQTPRLMLPAPKSVIHVTPEGVAFPPSALPLSPVKTVPKGVRVPKTAPASAVLDSIQAGGGAYQRSINTKQGEIVFFTDPRTNKVHRMHIKNVTKENVNAKLNPNLMGSKAPVGTAPSPEVLPEEQKLVEDLAATLKGTKSDKTYQLTPKPDPKAIIEAAGGKFVGPGEGLPGRGKLIYFNEPNGSTLTVYEDEITPKLISEKIATKKLEFEQATKKAAAKVTPSLKETLPPELVASATRKGGRPRSIVRAEGFTDAQARVVASRALISQGTPAEEAIKQTSTMDILKVRDLAEKELSRFRVKTGMTTPKGGRIQVREPGLPGPREVKGMPIETTETEVIEKGLKKQWIDLESLKDVPTTPATSLSKIRMSATSKGYEVSTDITPEGINYKLVAPGGETLTYKTLDDVSKAIGEVSPKPVQPVEVKGFDLRTGEPAISPFEKALKGHPLDEQDLALLRKQREFFEKTRNTLEGEISGPKLEEVARPPIQLVGSQQAGNITGITTRDELLALVDEIKTKGLKPVVMKAPGGYDVLYFKPEVDSKRYSELYYKMITKGPRSLTDEEMSYLNKMVDEGGSSGASPLSNLKELRAEDLGLVKHLKLKPAVQNNSTKAVLESMNPDSQDHLSILGEYMKLPNPTANVERFKQVGDKLWISGEYTSGFLTPEGKFLDTKEALKYALRREASGVAPMKLRSYPERSHLFGANVRELRREGVPIRSTIKYGTQHFQGRKVNDTHDDIVNSVLSPELRKEWLTGTSGKFEHGFTIEGVGYLSEPETRQWLKDHRPKSGNSPFGKMSRREFFKTSGRVVSEGKKASGSSPIGSEWYPKEGASYHKRDMNPEAWPARVREIAERIGQKGLDKLPDSWIEPLESVHLIPRVPGDTAGKYYWPPGLSKAKRVTRWGRGNLPGGEVELQEPRVGGTTMAHEVAHSGWFSVLPTEERAVFYQEVLKNPKPFAEAYGGPKYAQETIELFWDSIKKGNLQTPRNLIQSHAEELFAMAVAEKAGRTIRGAEGLKEVPVKTAVYGKLSPEARALIDKYVKTLLLFSGGYYATSNAKGTGVVPPTKD